MGISSSEPRNSSLQWSGWLALVLLALLWFPSLAAATPTGLVAIDPTSGLEPSAPELKILLEGQGFTFATELYSAPLTPAGLAEVGILLFTDRAGADVLLSTLSGTR